MSGGNWGIVSSATDKIIYGGFDYDKTRRVAKNMTRLQGFAFGIVEYEENFKFKIEDVEWVCPSLFDDFITCMKSHPYTRYSKHKNLIAICCGDLPYEIDGEIYKSEFENEEIICILEKRACKKFAKLYRNVTEEDFDYWIENEYASNDAAFIIFKAIEEGKVVKLWRK